MEEVQIYAFFKEIKKRKLLTKAFIKTFFGGIYKSSIKHVET